MKVSLQVLAVALTPVTAFLAVSPSSKNHLRQHLGLTTSFVAKDPPPLFGAYAKTSATSTVLFLLCASSSQILISHHFLP